MGQWIVGPNLRSDKVMSPTEAAYFAGFVDGEGTIGVYRARRPENRSGFRYQPTLVAANTYYPVLEALQRMCGNGRITQTNNPISEHHKTGFRLQFSSDQIRRILPQILPYLIVKKPQAEYVLEFLAVTVKRRNPGQAYEARCDELARSCKLLNARGNERLALVN